MLNFIREHGIIGSIFIIIALIGSLIFSIAPIGAAFRFIWKILFGDPKRRRRRKRLEEEGETASTDPYR